MMAAGRWLLTSGALGPLASASGVPVPADWLTPSTDVDWALLAKLGLLEPKAALPALLDPWRDPSLTALLTVSSTSQVAVDSGTPAQSFQAHLTLAGDRLVSLLRRDGVGLVELSCLPAEDLVAELTRVLDHLDGDTGAHPPVRMDRTRFEQLSAQQSPAGVLGTVTRIAQATVVGRSGHLTGALWYDAAGWWRVRAEGAEVLLEPGCPTVRDWAPLLDAVLV